MALTDARRRQTPLAGNPQTGQILVPICLAEANFTANYWSVGRAKSKADFIAKLGIVEEETDKSAFDDG